MYYIDDITLIKFIIPVTFTVQSPNKLTLMLGGDSFNVNYYYKMRNLRLRIPAINLPVS